MKSIIVYFSYSGNTKKVAEILAEYLKEKSEVESIRLKDLHESGNFFKQGSSAFKHRRAEIEEINFDFSGYDLICLGTPVWAFTTTPAVNTFLDKCFGVEGKQIILFTTSGGRGDKRCLNYMQVVLTKKGVKEFKKFSVLSNKIQDKESILFRIKEAVGFI